MRLIQGTKNLNYTLLQGDCSTDFTELVYNSKKVSKDCLFVCMKGAKFDAHTVIDEVVEAGAKGIVIEKDCPYPEGITVIRVESARMALAQLSAAYFGHPVRKMISIGITGTKGKTTTTHMLKVLLEKAGKKIGMIGTNGIFIGDARIPSKNTTPESYELHEHFAQMVKEGCDAVIMEVSSQGTKLHRTYDILFDYAVFTNISPDHIGPDEHADFDEYLHCKTLLFEQCRHALIFDDDDHANIFKDVSAKSQVCERVFTFGSKKSCDFSYADVEYLSRGSFLGISFAFLAQENAKEEKRLGIQAGIPGRFNVCNALAAVSLGSLLGLSDELLSNSLSDIHVDGRMEIAYSCDRYSVIVDYAHNALSMESLLKTLRDYQPKRLVVVFGCGGNRAKDRRYSMGEMAGKMADFSIITADNSRFEKTEDIMADIRLALEPTGGNFIEIADRREAIFYAIEHAEEGDMIAVIGKGHEDYQEMNGIRTHFSDREVVLEAVGSV